ncbi:MAG: glycosyltransferase family 4 protein [Vicinamibacterales bacterium]
MVGGGHAGRRPRVALDTRLVRAAPGGIATYVRELAVRMPPLDERREHLHVVPRGGTAFSAQARAARTLTPAHHRWERQALGLELLRWRVDLLHSPDFIAPVIGFRHSVVTVHDLAFLREPRHLAPDAWRYYAQVGASAARADAVITDSEAVRADVIERLRIPDARVVVVPLGRDPRCGTLAYEAVTTALGALGLAPGYLLCVSTFDPRKNLLGLLDEYRQLREAVRDVPPLVLAGHRTVHVAAVRAHAAALGLAPYVHLQPDVPDALMPGLHAGARIFVLLSRDEGFGLPLVDAMASGVPCVVSRRGALPEVAGHAARLVDPDRRGDAAEALAALLGDDVLARRLGAEGRQMAARYRWASTAASTLAVYDAVLGR